MGDPRSHPFVRLGRAIYSCASSAKQRGRDSLTRRSLRAEENAAKRKSKRKKSWFRRTKEVESSSDEEEDDDPFWNTKLELEPQPIDAGRSNLRFAGEDDDIEDGVTFRLGRSAGTTNHPFMVDDLDDPVAEFTEYLKSFSEDNPPPPIPQDIFAKLDEPVQKRVNKILQAQQAIERVGSEDIAQLNEMVAKNENIKDTRTMIPQEKLERAVQERLKRLKPALHLNGLLAFGQCEYVTANIGNITVPDIINVAGHNGAGGNIDVNGIYKRYPDNYDGRAVYQKVLERDEWEPQEQLIETFSGQLMPATLESGGRTFPTIHDSPRTKKMLKESMRCDKVLPAQRARGCLGDFRPVHRKECWFLFFDNLSGAWCIGPKPGSNLAFARCRGVEEAVPDNLGPEGWEIFDVGRRMWVKCDRLHTRKGGARVTLPYR